MNRFGNVLFIFGMATGLAAAEIEIGFPDGRSNPAWMVNVGSEWPGGQAAYYSKPMPDGRHACCLETVLGGGGRYAALTRRVTPVDFSGIAVELAPGDFKKLRCRFVDEAGQTFQYDFDVGEGDPEAFRTVRCSLETGKKNTVWGGAGDGKWHGRLTGFALLADSYYLEQRGISRLLFRSIRVIDK